MENISLPYHLLFPAVFSFVLLLILIFLRKKAFEKRMVLWVSLLVFFLCYLLICSSAAYDTINIELSASKYDLNKNGLYEQSEQTIEANKILSKISNDTGRNFAAITGFIFALIISIATFLIGSLLQVILKTTKK
jgi:hypothetical protein